VASVFPSHVHLDAVCGQLHDLVGTKLFTDYLCFLDPFYFGARYLRYSKTLAV